MAPGSPTARARLLGLLAAIVADGLTPDVKADLASLPELADLVDAARDADDEAADHQALFGFLVPPFAGVFLDESGRVGGRPAGQALHAYAAEGMAAFRDDLGPDHLATQLAFLAHCASRGADDTARAFVDGQVLSWLPGLVAAVLREPFPAWKGVLPVVQAAVTEYRGALGGAPFTAPPDAATGDLLADPGTGVRDIAEYLASPARSGVWVGRGDVSRIGRASEAPRGFGGRVLMLGNLLRSAADYGTLDAVLAAIDDLADATATHWSLSGSPWADVWTRRIGRTRALLGEIGSRLAAPADPQS